MLGLEGINTTDFKNILTSILDLECEKLNHLFCPFNNMSFVSFQSIYTGKTEYWADFQFLVFTVDLCAW